MAERRRSPRIHLDTTVNYRPNGDARRGHALNVGAGGLGFQPEEAVDPETVLLVEFVVPPEEDPIQATARVRWNEGGDDPACGVEFTEITDEARAQILNYIERILEEAVRVADVTRRREV